MNPIDLAFEGRCSLTKRDYIVILAMEGLLARGCPLEDVPELSIKMADLLVEELNKEPS